MSDVVILEVIYPYPVERVWRALTDRRILSRWLLPNDFEPRLGHAFSFIREDSARDREVIACEVIELQPPLRLGFTWREPSASALTIVTWTLTPVAEGTRLRLEHRGADTGVAGAWEHALAAIERILEEIQRTAAGGTGEDADCRPSTDQVQWAVERLWVGWREARVHVVAVRTVLDAGQAGTDAVIMGLSHPNPNLRRGCAEFLDDHGTAAHMETLLQTARTDPDAAVRSAAAHSLGCQRCKSAPLDTDLIGPLLEIALGDAHPRVRREALYRLCELPPDLRAAAALQTILRRETGRQVWSAAHRALGRHAGASPAPVDLVAPMIRNALAGEHPQIRRDATRWLGGQPANPRIAAVLRTVLEREANGESRAVAHRALMRHDAAYRQAHVERQRAEATS